MPKRICAVEECPDEYFAKGYCEKHYARVRRHGGTDHLRRLSPEAAAATMRSVGLIPQHPYPGRSDAKWLCVCEANGHLVDATHHSARKGHGCRACAYMEKGRQQSRENHHKWLGDDAGYGTVHDRVRAWRGPANGYQCIDCTEPAADWSYRGGSPLEREEDGRIYSTDVMAYDPRCKRCHANFDRGSDGPRSR